MALSYYPSGKLKTEEEYLYDRRNGLYVERSEEGWIKIKGNYRNEEKQGNWFEYNEKGKVIKTQVYRLGQLLQEKNAGN